MGKIEYRMKYRKLSCIAALLLCFALLLSGCADKTTEGDTKAAKETVQDKAEKQEDNKAAEEEIPSDLLPGQTADAGESTVTQNQSADGTVYTYENASVSGSGNNPGKNGSSGGNGTADSGNSGGGADGSSESSVIQISFSVDSSKADGSVSFSAAMTMDAGATVHDALAASGLAYSGKGYITEIGGLGEKMFGSQSGWKYYVNGSAPGKSCTSYVLKDGDKVQWRYVLKA